MMSSFKRKTLSGRANLPQGTRLSPVSTSTVITSTGIPSLDDILGGGLPLSCSLAVLAPDHHSAYGELVQKYFVAQGLASGQKVCIIHDEPLRFAREGIWMAGNTPSTPAQASTAEDADDEKASQHDDKIKIAWRYEQMKKFQTTVSSNSLNDDLCMSFDLTCRIPATALDAARQSAQLIPIDVDIFEDGTGVIEQIEELLSNGTDAHAVRICIPALGSPHWGDMQPPTVLTLLHSLRRLLHRHPNACASLSLAPHMCTDTWGGPGWVQKVGWLTDAAISMSAFGANPSLSSLFPSHHGIVQILTLPAPHTILPASDKYSTLRGLSSAAGSMGGSGENNLAFKCMRKRLIFETIHLDLEGGVTERRTTPSSNAMALDGNMVHETMPAAVLATEGRKGSLATVEVEFERSKEVVSDTPTGRAIPDAGGSLVPAKPKKPKKKVAFRSERPDLYDF
ncbi:PAXNEB-domain-containing protein [Suillus plorans]|uniref:Elongator complex protein 4 n=1 Tax=Suillus plorans TaxID=116603 RepID=A0A9P7J3R2_9AGAM|nr:PAXNEB-domain-containing protein [Suillus plorans]KAG1801409.1 PAXNEB-domain-containing protein [Suillus plorans]